MPVCAGSTPDPASLSMKPWRIPSAGSTTSSFWILPLASARSILENMPVPAPSSTTSPGAEADRSDVMRLTAAAG